MTSLAAEQTCDVLDQCAPAFLPPQMRWSKIAEAKDAIQAGRYDDPALIDEGLEACMVDLFADLAD